MRYNRFGHLSSLGRVQHLKEFLGIGTKYDELVEQEQALFGLDDWYIETMYAEGKTLDDMRKKGYIAFIRPNQDLHRATIYFDEEWMDDTPYSQAEVVDHEMAELILNPWLPDKRAVFDTGSGLDDTKSIHVARACELLRRGDPGTQVHHNDPLERIVEKARYLTWLSENDWRIQFEEINAPFLAICDGDKRLPGVAYSTYYQNNRGLALFGAREVIFLIDRGYIREHEPSVADLVLRELWRVVLNPYGKPDRTNVQERQLRHIMRAMEGLGWAKSL